MAQRREYRPGPGRQDAGTAQPDPARVAGQLAVLGDLVAELERQGVLRLLRDLGAAAPGALEIALRGLEGEGGRNALQNLVLLARELGRIEPAELERMLAALHAGLAPVVEPGPDQAAGSGLRVAWAVLSDGALWRSLAPLLEGLQAFRASLAAQPGRHE
ncbi:MAG TPA: DUF1641 domain-containing protein [Gammaproteobacteria bacterium]|nr:DUF1641 domain-containing protein [Gammaproteobacteria bacterium]